MAIRSIRLTADLLESSRWLTDGNQPTTKDVAELVRVIFRHPDGSTESHFGKVGESVMDVALDNGVAGIRAQCGGGCTCSTCHCYVTGSWFDLSGSMHPDESEMLEYTPERQANSRLSCQIRLTKSLDGIVVRPCVYDT